ncbi:MazG family protein [Myxococcota bacterium]|nr:MazG family protein [Myxococcota bacterium]
MAGIDELLRIMARLRDPERGCPWDLDQDFASISPHTIEEAYEVDEAIARGDLEALCDELGDLLFQVVFQARLGEERGAFDFARVVEGITAKLIRRHPHIFGDAASPGSPAAQVVHWESIKAAERAAKAAGRDGPADPFEGIPRALPALTRSAKLAGRLAGLRADGAAARTGGSEAIAEALLGVSRTGARAAHTFAAADGSTHDRDVRLRVVGDGIRAWVELACQLGVDPEQALRLEDDRATDLARRDPHQAVRSRLR